jgi:hypothetical protein
VQNQKTNKYLSTVEFNSKKQTNSVQRRVAVVKWLRQKAHDREVVGSNFKSHHMDESKATSYYIENKTKKDIQI